MSEQPSSVISRFCAWLDQSPLRYWTFHVCVSAAPSFVVGLGVGPEPQRVLGMVLGVVFFIALYTLSARWTIPNGSELPLWRRAIRLGTWIRTTWALLIGVGALLSLAFEHNPLGFLFMPDFFAGFLAYQMVGWLENVPVIRNIELGGFEPMAGTFLITIVGGFLLSGMLFSIAFICLGVLKLLTRRRRAIPATTQQ